ncbi:MAG: hypothetical protein IJI71_01655 [Clostridia bacterium]|nr:hypothetical protein [Clostridia bacterium]
MLMTIQRGIHVVRQQPGIAARLLEGSEHGAVRLLVVPGQVDSFIGNYSSPETMFLAAYAPLLAAQEIPMPMPGY